MLNGHRAISNFCQVNLPGGAEFRRVIAAQHESLHCIFCLALVLLTENGAIQLKAGETKHSSHFLRVRLRDVKYTRVRDDAFKQPEIQAASDTWLAAQLAASPADPSTEELNDDHCDLLFFFRNQTELISYTLLQGKLRRLGVQCMSTYARACMSIRFCPSCVLVLHCVRAVTSFTLLRPPTCRTWASLWRLVLGTMLPSQAIPCDFGSRCLLAGPLPTLHPCPLLLRAGFDTRLCSLSRICRL